jgi:hypothetical protein
MSVPLSCTPRKYSGTRQSPTLAITDGEINFLWSFIQGSIVIPENWDWLLRGYGFCERHAWTHVSVEMSFRDTYLLGPTILYSALIEKSLQIVRTAWRTNTYSVARKLRATDTCFLCALNIDDASAGASPRARLDRGRDSSRLRAFARGLEPMWRGYVCTSCAGPESVGSRPNSCRLHLLADLKAPKPIDLSSQKELLQKLHLCLTRYQSSFLAGGPLASDRDRAAFIIAVAWCSGWRPLLALLKQSQAEP